MRTVSVLVASRWSMQLCLANFRRRIPRSRQTERRRWRCRDAAMPQCRIGKKSTREAWRRRLGSMSPPVGTGDSAVSTCTMPIPFVQNPYMTRWLSVRVFASASFSPCSPVSPFSRGVSWSKLCWSPCVRLLLSLWVATKPSPSPK